MLPIIEEKKIKKETRKENSFSSSISPIFNVIATSDWFHFRREISSGQLHVKFDDNWLRQNNTTAVTFSRVGPGGLSRNLCGHQSSNDDRRGRELSAMRHGCLRARQPSIRVFHAYQSVLTGFKAWTRLARGRCTCASRLDNADILLGGREEGENIRNILALNRRFRGNKTRNIFAFRDIETFPILPPFSNGVITSGRIRKRNELYDMRTSRSPRSPLWEDFQRSGRQRVGVGSSNAKRRMWRT